MDGRIALWIALMFYSILVWICNWLFVVEREKGD